MLTKDEFRNYVKGWVKFNKYLDALYELDITVAEAPPVGNFNDNYVNLLCKTMEVKNDNLPWANILEDFLWNYDEDYSDEEIDNLYREIASRKFYSVEDEEDEVKETKINPEEIDHLLDALNKEKTQALIDLWMDYLLP